VKGVPHQFTAERVNRIETKNKDKYQFELTAKTDDERFLLSNCQKKNAYVSALILPVGIFLLLS